MILVNFRSKKYFKPIKFIQFFSPIRSIPCSVFDQSKKTYLVSDWSRLDIGTNQNRAPFCSLKEEIHTIRPVYRSFSLQNFVDKEGKMMQPQSKITSSTRETREGEILSVPILQTQGKDRVLTPPPSPEKAQHDLFWRETVLYWNKSDYRWSLIEYIPCLMGIIWEEERMGRIENLSSFPIEAQYYFVKGVDLNNLALSSTNYHRIFRTKISQPSMHSRRMSEPDIGGSRFSDPQGITQESFLFGRFLKHVLKTMNISCTVLILSLKFAQQFLHRVRTIGNPYCAGLESNQFRLFVTSLLLADKYSEDHPYTNKSWSSLSGLPVEDINTMERAFLAIMQHGLYTHEVEFREWTKSLQSLCQWNTPNPHHPENSRIVNMPYTSSVRRMSFSHTIGNSGDSSGSSISNHSTQKGTSFWARFIFHRK